MCRKKIWLGGNNRRKFVTQIQEIRTLMYEKFNLTVPTTIEIWFVLFKFEEFSMVFYGIKKYKLHVRIFR